MKDMTKRSLRFTFFIVLLATTAILLWPTDEVRTVRPKKSPVTRHENVLKHHKSHAMLPFKDILKKVRPHIKGEIIETEFEVEDGVPTYEFKYIHKNGYVLEMEVDARTGQIIKVERD